MALVLSIKFYIRPLEMHQFREKMRVRERER